MKRNNYQSSQSDNSCNTNTSHDEHESTYKKINANASFQELDGDVYPNYVNPLLLGEDNTKDRHNMNRSNLAAPEKVENKRVARLAKNREAAKECRRKKKDYIKSLEDRVNVLETQNSNLICQLKRFREKYGENF